MLRTLLILGRVSNLPTVWSNCLCAWILTGSEQVGSFILILTGTSSMYIGGMFLNDFCDVEFDTRHRPERPIPSALISRKNVFRISVFLIIGGFAVMAHINLDLLITSFLLMTLIVTYNIIHKKSPHAHLIMAGCRATLYLIVAALTGIADGSSILAAAAMFIYIASLSVLAQKEATATKVSFLPALLLFTPVFLLFCDNEMTLNAVSGVSILTAILWIIWSLKHSFASKPAEIGKTIALLLAGIPLIDLIKVLSIHPPNAFILTTFTLCFIVSLLAQKTIPAT